MSFEAHAVCYRRLRFDQIPSDRQAQCITQIHVWAAKRKVYTSNHYPPSSILLPSHPALGEYCVTKQTQRKIGLQRLFSTQIALGNTTVFGRPAKMACAVEINETTRHGRYKRRGYRRPLPEYPKAGRGGWMMRTMGGIHVHPCY